MSESQMSETIYLESLKCFQNEIKECQQRIKQNSESYERNQKERKQLMHFYIDNLDTSMKLEFVKIVEDKLRVEKLNNLIEDTSLLLKSFQKQMEDAQQMKEQDEAEKRRTTIRERIKIYMADREYVDFQGNNCNDDYMYEGKYICKGWNGFDRRCDCGNRRVDWDENRIYDYDIFDAIAY